MTNILKIIIEWVLRNLLNLLFIIFILSIGKVAISEWKKFQHVREEYSQLKASNLDITARVDLIARMVTERTAESRTASLQVLEQRVSEVDHQITVKRLENQKFSRFGQVMSGTPIVTAQLEGMRLTAEIKILEKERAYLLDLKLLLVAANTDRENRAKLEALRLVHENVYQRWKQIGVELTAYEDKNLLKSKFAFGSPEYIKRQQLLEQQDSLLNQNRQADIDFKKLDSIIKNTRPLTHPPTFKINMIDVQGFLKPMHTRMNELEQNLENNWFEKLVKPIEEVITDAFLILVSLILAPFAIKALFYFLLAPLASRRPSICLLPDTSGSLGLETGKSSVSSTITINDKQELLIHPEFLQSSSIQGEKDTQWLLDWRYPLTSLASNMVALTRIRTNSSASFVLSATKDPFSEIGILSIPQGSALIMQPHNLVGVIQPKGTVVRITSHWRLNSLHAWLTLQLRYLAFHGPVDLIVQGCRGVRLEKADSGRSVNQAATIGFSANLSYATLRCETFSSYFLGKQELLNDNFSGESGFYVYEEMPHYGKKTGVTGRGLDGFTDSLLKVLGI